MVTLSSKQLEEYARELFKAGNAGFADAEDGVVTAFLNKVVQKHSKPFSELGHYIMNGKTSPLVTPSQQVLNRPFDPVLFMQANEAESRL